MALVPLPKIGASLAFSLVSLLATDAVARTFALPEQRPAATIEIPDDWRPRQTDGGVDASANDGAVRLWVDFLPGSDRQSAEAAAMAKLTMDGVAPALTTKRSAPIAVNGFDATKIDYSGTDRNGEADITMILIDASQNAGFVMICYWGDDEAQESVGNDLQSVTESLATFSSGPLSR